jgi:hypothetical protein
MDNGQQRPHHRNGVRALLPVVALLLMVGMSRQGNHPTRRPPTEVEPEASTTKLGDSHGDSAAGRGRDDGVWEPGEIGTKFPVSLNDFYKGWSLVVHALRHTWFVLLRPSDETSCLVFVAPVSFCCQCHFAFFCLAVQ